MSHPYPPQFSTPSRPAPVVGAEPFAIAAIGLDHAHVGGMVEQLVAAGATLRWVYDPDPIAARALVARFPGAKLARAESEVLDDPAVQLVASAAVPSQRADLGIRVMRAGKHYFVDKAPVTTFAQLDAVRGMARSTSLKYAVYYNERIHSDAAYLADHLIAEGAIGRVLQVASFGPHRLGTGRPDWFFDPARSGGILCDIGSHNFEQMLHFTGAENGEVLSATTANYAHPDTPAFEDFGDAHVVLDNGCTGYVRVDWFTPSGLQVFGDGRTVILGTDGYIELRKNVNIATNDGPDQVFLVNNDGQWRINAAGLTGLPYFGQLIRDCLEGTDLAMPQAQTFAAAELSLHAQQLARRL